MNLNNHYDCPLATVGLNERSTEHDIQDAVNREMKDLKSTYGEDHGVTWGELRNYLANWVEREHKAKGKTTTTNSKRITRAHVASRAKAIGYELRTQRQGDAYGLRDDDARKNYRWVLVQAPWAPKIGAHTLSDLLDIIELREITLERYEALP